MLTQNLDDTIEKVIYYAIWFMIGVEKKYLTMDTKLL
jgi:hypothetical protein